MGGSPATASPGAPSAGGAAASHPAGTLDAAEPAAAQPSHLEIMPTRISLRRVEEPPRASSWPYPVRWPNFSRMLRRLENAPLLVGLKPRSKCSNQSFGRGASSYLCAVPYCLLA